jgi:hypothetical protein
MLTTGDRERLARDGVAVVPGLVRADLVAAARDAVCAAIGAEYGRRETWYAHEPLEWSVVPVHHAPAFWQLRQEPALHALFASLLGTERLWVSMDRAVFKVPEAAAHPPHVDASVLHWDMDPRAAARGVLQGMLYLTDTGVGEGAFECAPSIFRDLEAYLASHRGPLVDAPPSGGAFAAGAHGAWAEARGDRPVVKANVRDARHPSRERAVGRRRLVERRDGRCEGFDEPTSAGTRPSSRLITCGRS